MSQSRRIVSHPRIICHPVTHHYGGPHHRDESEKLKHVPWTTIVLLMVLMVLILALWGKLPARLRLQHQAPTGNAPGVSTLVIGYGL